MEEAFVSLVKGRWNARISVGQYPDQLVDVNK
jgi:hypothetical protein